MRNELMIPPNPARRVFGIACLRELARVGSSVYSPSGGSFRRPKAAAYVLNMSAGMVDGAIRAGLFVYTPKRPRLLSFSERKLIGDLECAVEALHKIAGGSPFSTGKIGSVRDAAEHAELTLRILGKWEGRLHV